MRKIFVAFPYIFNKLNMYQARKILLLIYMVAIIQHKSFHAIPYEVRHTVLKYLWYVMKDCLCSYAVHLWTCWYGILWDSRHLCIWAILNALHQKMHIFEKKISPLSSVTCVICVGHWTLLIGVESMDIKCTFLPRLPMLLGRAQCPQRFAKYNKSKALGTCETKYCFVKDMENMIFPSV